MKKLAGMILFVFILSFFGVTSYAQQSVREQPSTSSFSTKSIQGGSEAFSSKKMSNIPGYMTKEESVKIASGGVPSVTINQAKSWAERKGTDVTSFLQIVGQYLAMGGFIVCAFMALIGLWGNGSLVSKGVVGMVLTLCLYAAVLYAPELMDFFVAWVSE